MSIDFAVGQLNQWNIWLMQHPWILLLIVVWAVFWKGLALWFSARGSQPVWFVLLLIINTVGLFEIIYLLFFRRRRRIY